MTVAFYQGGICVEYIGEDDQGVDFAEPSVKAPEICAEVHNARPASADRAWAAVLAMCEGAK